MTAREARDYLRLAGETATGCEAVSACTGLRSVDAIAIAVDRLPDAEAVSLAHEVAVLVCRKVGR